jgi:hypothetical protein
VAYNVLDLFGGDRRRPPGAWIIEQPIQTGFHEPRPSSCAAALDGTAVNVEIRTLSVWKATFRTRIAN